MLLLLAEHGSCINSCCPCSAVSFLLCLLLLLLLKLPGNSGDWQDSSE
jgi:hypothetical protein